MLHKLSGHTLKIKKNIFSVLLEDSLIIMMA